MAHPSARLAAVFASLWLAWPAPRRRASARARSVRDGGRRATGAPLTELTPRDVVIREDGVAREVLRVSRATGPDAGCRARRQQRRRRIGHPRHPRPRSPSFVTALGDLGPVALISMAERPTVVTDYATAPDALAKPASAGCSARPGSGVTLLEAVRRDRRRHRQARKRTRGHRARERRRRRAQQPALLARARPARTSRAPRCTPWCCPPPGRASLDDAARQRDMLFDRGVRETGGLRRDVLSSMAIRAGAGRRRASAHPSVPCGLRAPADPDPTPVVRGGRRRTRARRLRPAARKGTSK